MSSLLNPTALPDRAVSDELKAARAAAQDATKTQQAAFQAWQDARAERDALKHKLSLMPELMAQAETVKDHQALAFEKERLPAQIKAAELAVAERDAERMEAEVAVADAEHVRLRLELDTWKALAARVEERLQESQTMDIDGHAIPPGLFDLEQARMALGYSPTAHRRASEAFRNADIAVTNSRGNAMAARQRFTNLRYEGSL